MASFSWTLRIYESIQRPELLWFQATAKRYIYELDETNDRVPTKAWLMVKSSWDDADNLAKISKEITTTPSSAGQIIPATASANAELQFDISADDSAGVSVGDYIIGVKVFFEDGQVFVLNNTVTRFKMLPGVVQEH